MAYLSYPCQPVSLLIELSELVGAAFATCGLDPALGEVVLSQRPELGQFQCNGALAGARQARRSPADVASDVVAIISQDERLARVEIAGPGFINLSVTDSHLAKVLQRIRGDDRRGADPVSEHQSVVVDYGGPNVAKAMHVGHLRATIIGDSIARMFDFVGHRVIRDPHFGDWGLQMGILIAALQEREPDLPYFDAGHQDDYPTKPPVTLDDLQQIYPEAARRIETDDDFAERARQATVQLQQGHPGYRALWRHMKEVSMASQRADFADLGVTFDLWYGESDVHDRIDPMIRRLIDAGVATESDGALVVRVEQVEDSRDLPPLILKTSAGGYLYSTTDLATIDMRVQDLDSDLILYVVDARQADHFEQVFRAARLGGIAPGGVALEHIKFGTMNGPDRKPFKTRAGGVVSLRDLIAMVTEAAEQRLDEAEIARDYDSAERAEIARKVGIAALKFGDLSNNRTSDYIFDLDRFCSFEGKTGPYLQYASVRIGSILRNADGQGVSGGPIIAPAVDVERSLMLEISRFSDVISRAIDLRAPNHMAEFAYELAGAFNRFYETCHILSESDPARQASWVSLVEATKATLDTSLFLLGIEVPDRM